MDVVLMDPARVRLYQGGMRKADPIRPTDDQARSLARQLLDTATFAALGVLDPDTGAPSVTRIAMATAPDGRPMTLISDLSAHAAALGVNPVASLLVGEPADKGDPLTHPRLTLQVTANATRHGAPGHAALSAHYLALRPKATLYAGFADFFFVTFDVTAGFLNAGFGQAYRLKAADLAR